MAIAPLAAATAAPVHRARVADGAVDREALAGVVVPGEAVDVTNADLIEGAIRPSGFGSPASWAHGLARFGNGLDQHGLTTATRHGRPPHGRSPLPGHPRACAGRPAREAPRRTAWGGRGGVASPRRNDARREATRRGHERGHAAHERDDVMDVVARAPRRAARVGTGRARVLALELRDRGAALGLHAPRVRRDRWRACAERDSDNCRGAYRASSDPHCVSSASCSVFVNSPTFKQR
jgi:hypothetical protein